MNEKFIEILLNLFDQCQQQRKELIIDVEKDVLRVHPTSINLIYSLLSDRIPSIFTRLINEKKQIQFQNSLKLCSNDQREANSCRSTNCFELHLCLNYLLNNQCLEFQSDGQCSHSHSFETKHNKRVLDKSFLDDQFNGNPMEFIGHLLRLTFYQDDLHYRRPSLTFRMTNQQNLTKTLISHLFSSYHELIKRQILLDSSTILFTFEDEEATSLIEEVFHRDHSKKIQMNKSFYLDEFFLLRTSSNETSKPKMKSFSTRLNNLTSSNVKFNREKEEILRQDPIKKPTQFSSRLKSSRSPPNFSSSNVDRIDYFYSKRFSSENLSFLLGPIKSLVEQKYPNEIYPFLSSGFCRVPTNDHGEMIEKYLNSILPDSLSNEPVAIPNHFRLFIDSPFIEDFLVNYRSNSFAIVTESKLIQLPIHLIKEDQQRQTNSFVHSDDEDHFRVQIKETNSSINVLKGNICQIEVDLMICISTSYNLRDNVLRHAGPTVTKEFQSHQDPQTALITSGGSTSAKKILFLPWHDQPPSTDEQLIEQSLAARVEWSIDQAIQKGLKSISFPPVGTGQLAFDPTLIAETMIKAVHKKLLKDQLDVFFVIYQSDECFQVFRLFLENLLDEKRNSSKKISSIERICSGKLLYTLSDRSQTKENHRHLIESLEKLYVEQSFDLQSIDRRFSIEDLIDQCLKYRLYPEIDFLEKKLTIRGDRQSIEQCFYQLQHLSNVYQYFYLLDEKEILLNSFISLRIDEALLNSLSNISIEENSQLIYQIDLKQNQISLNREKEKYLLKKRILNETRRQTSMIINQRDLPRSSFSSLMCFHQFHQTMPETHWIIERIVQIENPRLNFFCSLKETDRTDLYFYGTSSSSIQSIIHYGFHSSINHDRMNKDSICFTSDARTSHFNGSNRSTNGTFHLIVASFSSSNGKQSEIHLSNDQLHITRPIYFLVYRLLYDDDSI